MEKTAAAAIARHQEKAAQTKYAEAEHKAAEAKLDGESIQVAFARQFKVGERLRDRKCLDQAADVDTFYNGAIALGHRVESPPIRCFRGTGRSILMMCCWSPNLSMGKKSCPECVGGCGASLYSQRVP